MNQRSTQTKKGASVVHLPAAAQSTKSESDLLTKKLCAKLKKIGQ
jgi:hypothetical protein